MSPGFLIQCDANGHVSYMRKKSSKSNSNFSLKRMQCSIFSNTVYKAELHQWYWGESAKADPSLKQWQASCIFTTAPFQSILMVQTLLCADLITLHIKRKKKIKIYIYICLSKRHPQWQILLLSQYPNGSSRTSVQLCLTDVRKMSNLSRWMSHAEIARHKSLQAFA